MINQLLDLYIFIVLIFTLYKLVYTAYKTRGGIVGRGLIYFSLGFTIIFLVTLQSILETSFNLRLSDVFGNDFAAAITRLGQAIAFLTFAVGAAKFEKILS